MEWMDERGPLYFFLRIYTHVSVTWRAWWSDADRSEITMMQHEILVYARVWKK